MCYNDGVNGKIIGIKKAGFLNSVLAPYKTVQIFIYDVETLQCHDHRSFVWC